MQCRLELINPVGAYDDQEARAGTSWAYRHPRTGSHGAGSIAFGHLLVGLGIHGTAIPIPPPPA